MELVNTEMPLDRAQMPRRIFIDCGGHDGCSVVKFLSERPDFECVTFEPNPVFRRYYRFLPTDLRQSAVTTYDGRIEMLLDPVDADGSSILDNKKIDAKNFISNDQCPRLTVNAVDLSRFIEQSISRDDYVVLKLDVEGAEYAIIDRLVDTGTIEFVDELFVEFHGEKLGMSERNHSLAVSRVGEHVSPKHWDARPYAVYRRGLRAYVVRAGLIVRILWKRFIAQLAQRS